MKRMISTLLILACILPLASCAATQSAPAPAATEAASPAVTQSETESGNAVLSGTAQSGSTSADAPAAAAKSKILVVYFSRTGEQYVVGVIEEGNTAIVAKLIAEKTGADTFEILPESDYYPYTYKELTDVAKQEQRDKARPKIKDALPDLTDYETIFIGAPVWWGDWPMILYTFFESADLSGKKLVPFSTHEGSGLSGFDKKLASAAPKGEVLTGLAIRGGDCQNDKTGVDKKVAAWLKELGY